jgi:hypothetical protein
MSSTTAAALVCAGLVSVVLYPALALGLLRDAEEAQVESRQTAASGSPAATQRRGIDMRHRGDDDARDRPPPLHR